MATDVIKLVETDSEFLEKIGNKIELSGEEWFFIPHWFMKVAEGKYVFCSFENLPERVKKAVEDIGITSIVDYVKS